MSTEANQASDAAKILVRKIYGFSRNLEDLRDFVEVTSELFAKKYHEDVTKNPEAFIQHLINSSKEIPGAFDPVFEPDMEQKILDKFPEKFEFVEVEKAGGTKVRQLQSKPGQTIDVSVAAQLIEKSIKRKHSLRRNALISLISASEWFAAQVLHFFFDKYPSAAGLDDRTLTYEALLKFGSIEDARNWLVGNKIEDILRGSFTDWVAFFKERLHIDKELFDDHIPYCQEACLRRNLLVHNGGVVNSVYLKKLPAEIKDIPEEGSHVAVEDDYYEDRLNRFEVFFIVFALEIWKKIEKREELRLDIGVQLSFDALSRDRWLVARGISKYVLSQSDASEQQNLNARVNYWQSFKWAGDFEKVQKEVEKWDVSAKGVIYQAAKDILLDQEEAAIQKLGTLVSIGALPSSNIKGWPLFRSLREKNRLDGLLSSAEQAEAAAIAGVVSDPTPKVAVATKAEPYLSPSAAPDASRG